MEKLGNMIPQIGKTDATKDTQPSPNCERRSVSIESMERTAELFSWCLIPDVADKKVYLAAVAAIFDEYPQRVACRLADPRSGSRMLRDYPSILQIRQACDELNAPFERERRRYPLLEREQPRAPRTPEEQARVDAQVVGWRKSAGVPESGTRSRGIQRGPLPEISRARRAAVAADREARKARKQAHAYGEPTGKYRDDGSAFFKDEQTLNYDISGEPELTIDEWDAKQVTAH
jgi:hypothetical protein